MKIEGYEEISDEEYCKLPEEERAAFLHEHTTYFKKSQKFPIVFEDDVIKIYLDKEGLNICDKTTSKGIYLWFKKSFPLLVKGVKKAEEVMKNNEN